jgi:hypothetical protein
VEENCKNLVPLLKLIPGFEDVYNDNMQEWIHQDEQLTDNGIDFVNHAGGGDLEDNEGSEKADRMNHGEGLKSVKTSLAYAEQYKKAVAADVLLFRCWCDLATEKRREVRSNYPLLFFQKNKLLRLQIYIMLNTVFVCVIFFT